MDRRAKIALLVALVAYFIARGDFQTAAIMGATAFGAELLF
jgi:hypothetical protein